MISGGGGDTTGIYRVEARDAAEYPIMYRTAPTMKNYPVCNISSAEVEKICFRY